MAPEHRIFRGAASRVHCQGWIRSRWYNQQGRICGLMAVAKEVGIKEPWETWLPMPFLLELDKTLQATGTYCTGSRTAERRRQALQAQDAELLQQVIYGWNDAPGRTQQEVIDVLNQTADRLEAEKLRRHAETVRTVRPVTRLRHYDDSWLEEAEDRELISA